MRSTTLWVLVLVGCGKKDEETPAPVVDCVAGPELQAALDEAAAGEPIELCAGTHTGTWMMSEDVELVSSGGATLDGGGAAPVLLVATGVNATLRGIVVQGGLDAEAYAGGIDAGLAASLTLEGCTVRDNTGLVGGILGPQAGPVVLLDTTIATNSGEVGGMSVGEATLTGATITGNFGDFYGGGVEVVSGGTVTADANTVLEANHSEHYGGGVFLWDGTTWTGGTIRGNDAVLAGGGMVVWSPRGVTIDGARIEANTTPAQGGGIALFPQGAGATSIVGTTITGNGAHDGGGMHLLPGDHTVELVGTAVDGNTAVFGGAIYFGATGAPSEDVIIGAGSSISGNSADRGAGILLKSPATVQVIEATVSDNAALIEGGGALLDDGTLTSQTSDWVGNTPDDVWVGGVAATSLGTDASFSCNALQQQCK